jgi:hypothetical protein
MPNQLVSPNELLALLLPLLPLFIWERVVALSKHQLVRNQEYVAHCERKPITALAEHPTTVGPTVRKGFLPFSQSRVFFLLKLLYLLLVLQFMFDTFANFARLTLLTSLLNQLGKLFVFSYF